MKIIKLTESELVGLVKKVIKENEQANEQLLKNIGDKIKTGVNKVAQKVVNATQKQQPAEPVKDAGRDLDQLKTEWSKTNSDMTNMNGFGEAIGQTENAATSQGQFKARVAILNKMKKQSASFGSEIVDEAYFRLENGNYHYLVIMKPTNYEKSN